MATQTNDLKDLISSEMERFSNALRISQEGLRQNPEDEEWSTMCDLYAEIVESLTKIDQLAKKVIGNAQ